MNLIEFNKINNTMSNILYITSRNYIAHDVLIVHLVEKIGIEIEIVEYNSNMNCSTDYVVKFKEKVPDHYYGTFMLINYLAVYLYSTNEKFTRPSMLLCKHHYNVDTGNQYVQYITGPTTSVYNEINYRLVETTDTPFLFL